MTRMTPNQFALFQKAMSGDPRPAKGKSPKAPRPRLTAKERAALPENVLEAQIGDFLRARGWTVTKQHVGSFLPTGAVMRLIEQGQQLTKDKLFRAGIVRIGERGDPDWRAERLQTKLLGQAQVFYYETKAYGKEPTPEQKERMRQMTTLGWLVAWFDDIDKFMTWYNDRFK